MSKSSKIQRLKFGLAFKSHLFFWETLKSLRLPLQILGLSAIVSFPLYTSSHKFLINEAW